MRSIIMAAVCAVSGTAWAAEATAKDKFSEKDGWIELFNGQDLKGWHARNPNAKMSWKVDKGILTNDLKWGQHGVDIVTDQKFDDFQLHIEFKVPPMGNSGVYLRGRYEIQVAHSLSKKLTAQSCGAIYSLKAPSENASLKPGEWQSYDVTLKGKTVTVHQNGKLIIDNYEIPRPTGGTLDDKVDEPGPLMLQGDHTAVDYRNIFIKPLKK